MTYFCSRLESGFFSFPADMDLVEQIHPHLAKADFTKTSTLFKSIFGSLAFFICIFLSSHLISKVTQTYKTLRVKEQIFWNLAVVRAVFGIFCTLVGIWAFFLDTELEKDVIYGTTPTSFYAMTTTVGFFCFECLAVSLSDIYYRRFSMLLNIHHWISLIGYTTVLIIGSSHFFGTRGLLLEMSTPFSAVCWIVLKAGKASSIFWKINQFLLVHSFHLRSVVECSLWYSTYKHWETVKSTMPIALFIPLYTQLVLVTFIMTPYWTYKKTSQMINPVDWNFEDGKKQKQS